MYIIIYIFCYFFIIAIGTKYRQVVGDIFVDVVCIINNTSLFLSKAKLVNLKKQYYVIFTDRPTPQYNKIIVIYRNSFNHSLELVHNIGVIRVVCVLGTRSALGVIYIFVLSHDNFSHIYIHPERSNLLSRRII